MKMAIITGVVVLLALGIVGYSVTPIRTEHGWKTPYVVSTRYSNPQIGFNIGLSFPLNADDIDRAEISEFIEMHGGVIFQSGGYRGAESYVKFNSVKDASSADSKIKEILPGLTILMMNINNKAYTNLFEKKYKAWDLAHNPQWPDTTPPDKTDPYWKFNNNLNENGTQYHKVEVTPGKWQWKVDEASMKAMQEAENAKWDLYYSLAKRKMSHAELMHVYEGMNTRNMEQFFQVDIDAAMYDMLATQWELQTGHPMDGYMPLSTAKGEWNRSPQEGDNKRAVETLIRRLQETTEGKSSTSDKPLAVLR